MAEERQNNRNKRNQSSKRGSRSPRGNRDRREEQGFDKDAWTPKTSLGKKVKEGKITLDEILESGIRIMEPEIVDALVPNLESELLLIGQAKGKFGGGQRRVFKQTQKKTNEGNKPSFATFVVVGDKKGLVGLGYGKARETVPAREKAIRNAKLNVMKIRKGCGSWQCGCKESHSIPFAVEGKCGSVRVKLMPAPKGTGLIVESECQQVLSKAGIQDVWSRTLGQTKTKINLIKACQQALTKLGTTKIHTKYFEPLGISDTDSKEEAEEQA